MRGWDTFLYSQWVFLQSTVYKTNVFARLVCLLIMKILNRNDFVALYSQVLERLPVRYILRTSTSEYWTLLPSLIPVSFHLLSYLWISQDTSQHLSGQFSSLFSASAKQIFRVLPAFSQPLFSQYSGSFQPFFRLCPSSSQPLFRFLPAFFQTLSSLFSVYFQTLFSLLEVFF